MNEMSSVAYVRCVAVSGDMSRDRRDQNKPIVHTKYVIGQLAGRQHQIAAATHHINEIVRNPNTILYMCDISGLISKILKSHG